MPSPRRGVGGRMLQEPEQEPAVQRRSVVQAGNRWEQYVPANYSRHGPEALRDWIHKVGGDSDRVHMYNMFDKHGVVDIMTREESIDVGVQFSHMENACNVLCSFGSGFRQSTFYRHPWLPFIAELDGYCFVDSKWSSRSPVVCYQEPWMSERTIGCTGTKGEFAQLLQKPALLFDDRIENLAGLPESNCQGVLVPSRRRDRAAWHPAATSPAQWMTHSMQFLESQSRFSRTWG